MYTQLMAVVQLRPEFEAAAFASVVTPSFPSLMARHTSIALVILHLESGLCPGEVPHTGHS